jgi:hypothetical protein
MGSDHERTFRNKGVGRRARGDFTSAASRAIRRDLGREDAGPVADRMKRQREIGSPPRYGTM